MKQKTKRYLLWGLLFGGLLLFFLIPVLIAWPSLEKEEAKQGSTAVALPKIKEEQLPKTTQNENMISVYRVSQEKVEDVALDAYLFGVLAGEMPASFEMEALKAQAVAARTYIARIVSQSGESTLPEDADVTDTVTHQVYHSDAELKKIWGEDYSWRAKKIRQAIAETDDLVLTYEGALISALFFSTSNGYTENSEEYWKNPFPYLKSVHSPWDLDSPKYLKEQAFRIEELNEKLDISMKKGAKLMEQVKRTTGQAIATVKIGGKMFTGREVREKLGLRSADFSMAWDKQEIVITTKGYGHQVGMSQYGANGMAKEGKTFQEILAHYYTGTKLEEGLSFFVDGKI